MKTKLGYFIADPQFIKPENPFYFTTFSLIDPLLIRFRGLLTQEEII